ncbi:hypothetical protein R6Z07M_009486 [Ovis aries]
MRTSEATPRERRAASTHTPELRAIGGPTVHTAAQLLPHAERRRVCRLTEALGARLPLRHVQIPDSHTGFPEMSLALHGEAGTQDFSYNQTFTCHPAQEAKPFRHSTFTALKLAGNGGDREEKGAATVEPIWDSEPMCALTRRQMRKTAEWAAQAWSPALRGLMLKMEPMWDVVNHRVALERLCSPPAHRAEGADGVPSRGGVSKDAGRGVHRVQGQDMRPSTGEEEFHRVTCEDPIRDEPGNKCIPRPERLAGPPGTARQGSAHLMLSTWGVIQQNGGPWVYMALASLKI